MVTSAIYEVQSQQNNLKHWVIHDPPINVYGELHFGHFYNKTVQDIINRFKLLTGHKIHYSMGITFLKKKLNPTQY